MVKDNGRYICENLNTENNACGIYEKRPLDCRLYPFLLVKKGNALKLGLHKSCCFIEERQPRTADIQTYAQYLKDRLSAASFISALRENPEISADYQENVEIITDLKDVFAKTYLPKLNKLTLKDKPLIERYLNKSKTTISTYHFANIFIWKKLFQIFWTIINENLCIFYQDGIGVFMPLAPLGKSNALTIKKCFEIMNTYNENREISRIENIPEKNLALYTRIGLKPKLKDTEYICARKSLVTLPGDSYKHKRSSYNYFVKNYNAELVEYKNSYCEECLALYRSWSHQRKATCRDSIYQQMLEDGLASFKAALGYYQKLGLSGYVVKVDAEIKGCSLGYPLNQETFCILFEVCDLQLKGIAQFVFREFCKKLHGYTHINMMGESALESLKKVKLSYRPVKEAKVYSAYEK